MEKAETLSFPMVKGSGGLGQSLHGEILVGAKGLRLGLPYSLDFEVRFTIAHRLRDHKT